MREVLRIVEGVRATISFHASIAPRPDYARLISSPELRNRLGWFYAWRNEVLNVQTDIELSLEDFDIVREILRCGGAAPLFQSFLLLKRTRDHTRRWDRRRMDVWKVLLSGGKAGPLRSNMMARIATWWFEVR